MKKIFHFFIVLIISLPLCGCSFMTSYVVRNFSQDNVVFSFKPFDKATQNKQQVKIAREIVKLKSSGLKKLKESIELTQTDSLYSFVLPHESSADISFLFDRHFNVVPDEVAVYRNAKRIATLKNMVGATGVFKEKSPGLFGGGGRIFYYDIK